MNNYAIVINGIVDNVVVWDGVAPFDQAQYAVLIPPGSPAWIGWHYDGQNFTPPA